MIKQHQQKLTKICQDLPGNTGPEDTKWFLQHAYTAAWACEGGSALASPRKKHHAKIHALQLSLVKLFEPSKKTLLQVPVAMVAIHHNPVYKPCPCCQDL